MINESGEEDDINELFAVMDVDGDGGVNEEEFEAAPLIKDCEGQGAETVTEEPVETDIDNDEEDWSYDFASFKTTSKLPIKKSLTLEAL
ncbi:hypothetical protein KUTeg_015336 [Tegillarca granosa]|uniref:EF-hand domain-containing protein n=1 Tax=Tegillarca granosa TaxID=220873 RepID=A0ABQ9EPT9_TEGGR|nr:hypothetical protein KUTeg_015336 [Tegillarca granosa]